MFENAEGRGSSSVVFGGRVSRHSAACWWQQRTAPPDLFSGSFNIKAPVESHCSSGGGRFRVFWFRLRFILDFCLEIIIPVDYNSEGHSRKELLDCWDWLSRRLLGNTVFIVTVKPGLDHFSETVASVYSDN